MMEYLRPGKHPIQLFPTVARPFFFISVRHPPPHMCVCVCVLRPGSGMALESSMLNRTGTGK